MLRLYCELIQHFQTFKFAHIHCAIQKVDPFEFIEWGLIIHLLFMSELTKPSLGDVYIYYLIAKEWG